MIARLRALVRRRRLEADMQEELRAHLDRAMQRLVARGMSPEDARLAARREFGNLAVVEEDARDARGWRRLESLVADVRFALRYFARKPLTTATIVIVLALGIGVNSALFSVIQAFTTRPAPAVPKDPAHARIYGFEQQTRGARWQLRQLSYAELRALAARSETFSSVAGWTRHDVVMDRNDDNGPRALRAEFVTPAYWTTLGVPLVSGPGFAVPGASPDFAAIIAFSLAEELFADPSAAIGQTLVVNDVPVRIVGVAPPRFQGAVPSSGRPALWFPVSARAEVTQTSLRSLTDSATLNVFARLAPGVTGDQASVIAREIAVRAPGATPVSGVVRSAQVLPMRGARPSASPDAPVAMYVVFSAIAILILLVACTNVSSLLVAAAVGRRHEIAVRLSLGASRRRLLRQLLTESAMLASAAGCLGLLLYWWVTQLVSTLPLNVELAPDLVTVGFTLVFALGTGILFGLSPALHAIRGGVGTALRDSGAGASHRSRLQRTFVVAQIVFSQPLLVVLAVLLAVTAGESDTFPEDAVASRIISARFRPVDNRPRTCSVAAGCERLEPTANPHAQVEPLIERIAARPGVVGVVPEAQAFAIRNITTHPAERGSGPRAVDVIRVHVEGTAPGYFGMLEVPIILGRDVALADTIGDAYAVVMGSDLARDLWGDENPIGRRLASVDWRAGARDSIAMVVIGVFDKSHVTTRGVDNRVYTAYRKHWRTDNLLIRTQGPAIALVPSLRTFVRAQSPDLPIAAIESLSEVGRRNREEAMQVAGATAAAGALALLLASIGLYAVVALAVGQRKREIGIRIALGGKPSRVVAMFFASGMRLSAIGLLIGLPLSVLGFRLLVSFVIAPKLNLPLIGLGIALVVFAVAAAATWFPARRAATIDPTLALRSE